jgi:hypothetical protein
MTVVRPYLLVTTLNIKKPIKHWKWGTEEGERELECNGGVKLFKVQLYTFMELSQWNPLINVW